MNDKVDKAEIIVTRLGELFTERRIIARAELLQRVYQYVREAGLDEAEREELEKMLGKDHVAAGIFADLLSGDSVFINLPHPDSAITLNGRIFHFVHAAGNYGDDDFEGAYDQFQAALEELKGLVVLNLQDLLVKFMGGADYLLEHDSHGRIIFASGEKTIAFRIFPAIEDVMIVEGMDGSVVIVPHEESPGPFVDYFQEKGVATEEAGVKIWVANMEGGSISPFIGYPKDMAVYKQFKNPKMALMVKDLWGRKMV